MKLFYGIMEKRTLQMKLQIFASQKAVLTRMIWSWNGKWNKWNDEMKSRKNYIMKAYEMKTSKKFDENGTYAKSKKKKKLGEMMKDKYDVKIIDDF